MPLPVGVLGGTGPLATAHFLRRVVELTDAAQEQDHVRLIVMQDPAIPDRTSFLTHRSDADPGVPLVDNARTLERCGVSFLVMPCNTAHHFADRIAAAVEPPLVSIVDATVEAVLRRRPGAQAVGVLSTDGSSTVGLYPDAFRARGIKALEPDPSDQALVMEQIYGRVKAGRPADPGAVRDVVDRLLGRGADLVVVACTELSVIASQHGLLDDPVLVDSLDALARATILRAGRVAHPDTPSAAPMGSARASSLP
ncbi:aspartate/glutamate racemase family protein [Antribacter gilvus]|uniref:aspartate/glutamate racemase family protein n=1 Tax=Antribacter gilvus TaxID=2304675 RepID=UPI001F0B7601|nr:amino acid racemase [Antribacter gilvus]